MEWDKTEAEAEAEVYILLVPFARRDKYEEGEEEVASRMWLI